MPILLGFLFFSFLFSRASLKKFSFKEILDSLKSLPAPLFMLAGILSYMALSSLWSFSPLYALGTSFRLLGVLFMGSCILLWIPKMSQALITRCLWIFSISWVILITLLFLTLLFYWIFQLPPSFFYAPSRITTPALFAALFFWPSCAFLFFLSRWHSRFFFLSQEKNFLTAGFCVCFLTLLCGMSAVPLGLMIGLMGYGILKKFPKIFSIFLNSAVGAGFIFPFFVHEILLVLERGTLYKASWMHRLIIWDFVAGHTKEALFFGWGMEASRFFPSKKYTLKIPQLFTKIQDFSLDTLPLHPHNAFLQLWLEGGFLGAFLLALFLSTIIYFMKKKFSSPQDRALLGGTFLTALVPFYLSFGVWQTWWVSSLCFLSILWGFLKKSSQINA